LFDALARPPGELNRIQVPERVGERFAEGAVVGEDLDVVPAAIAAGLEGAEGSGEVEHAVSGKHAVEMAARRLTPVSDVHAGDTPGVCADLLGVGDVPGVEQDADVLIPDQLHRVADRVHEREDLGLGGVDGLERDRHARRRPGNRDRANTLADDLSRVVSPTRRAGQEEHADRIELGQPPDARAQAVHTCLRLLGALHQRQGEDRGRRGHAVRRDEAALAQAGGGIGAELVLANADPADARCGVGSQVLVEARTESREFADPDPHDSNLVPLPVMPLAEAQNRTD
jgi:hypothetical protein